MFQPVTTSGQLSDQSARNLTPGAEPGKWIAPNIWETHDQGKGIKKPLTVLHLFAGACSTSSANPAEKFCNSIVDASGTHKLPKICGGTAPNFSDYNPTAEALGEIAPEIQALANAASNQAEEIIKANRTKIFMVVGVIFLLILIIYMWAS